MKLYTHMTPENTALVVIDIVNGCCHEDCEDANDGITFSKIRDMVPKLMHFIDEFRGTVGGKVVFTNITPWTKAYLPENIRELYEDPHAAYYGEKSGFEEEFYSVVPEKGDIIITKNSYDAFTNPEFGRMLEEKGMKYLVITGVFTDGCVLSTVCNGFSRGYNFVLIRDLIETTDVAIRQELSEQLKNYTFPIMYGRTMDSGEFIKSFGLQDGKEVIAKERENA